MMRAPSFLKHQMIINTYKLFNQLAIATTSKDKKYSKVISMERII